MEVVASLKTLFTLAGERGRALTEMRRNPSAENVAAFEAADRRHEEYRQMCLEADRVIDFPDLSDAALQPAMRMP